MKLSKFVRGIIFLTILSLIYIHLQMQIFAFAYRGKLKEQKIYQLREENGNTTYNIFRLKSAHNLGYKLLDEDSDMQFLDGSQIVKVEVPQSAEEKIELSAVSSRRASNPILSFLSLRSQAEARPQE